MINKILPYTFYVDFVFILFLSIRLICMYKPQIPSNLQHHHLPYIFFYVYSFSLYDLSYQCILKKALYKNVVKIA